MPKDPTVNVAIPLKLYDLLRSGCVVMTPQDFRALRIGIKHGVTDPQLKQDLLGLQVHLCSTESAAADTIEGEPRV